MGEAKRKGPLAVRQAAAVAESNRLEGEFRAFLREVTSLEKRIALPMLATRHVAEKQPGLPQMPARLVLVRFDELAAWVKAHGVATVDETPGEPEPAEPETPPKPVHTCPMCEGAGHTGDVRVVLAGETVAPCDQSPAAVRRALGFGGEEE